MTEYTIGIEKLLNVNADTEEEAIKKAHDKLQKQPIQSEELKVLEAVKE